MTNFSWNDYVELRELCGTVPEDASRLTLRLRDVVGGLLDILRPGIGDPRLIEEDIAIAICCGAGCDAANRSDDMGPDAFAKRYGCESKEIFAQAEAVCIMIRAKLACASAVHTANITDRR